MRLRATGFARICGVFFIGLGLLGFFVREAFGMHFDLVHNLVHLIVGTLAISCVMSGEASVKQFMRITGVFFALLAAIGFTNPGFFGIMHAEMTENVLHLALAVLGLWFGYGDRVTTRWNPTKST
jgi:hypothetical protein